MQAAEKLIFLIILGFFLIFIPDMIRYTGFEWKAIALSEFATEQMATNGGWNSTVESNMNKRAAELQISTKDWHFSHTTGDNVLAPNQVYFRMSAKYHVRAFSIFGKDMDNAMQNYVNLPVTGSSVTTSRIWYK